MGIPRKKCLTFLKDLMSELSFEGTTKNFMQKTRNKHSWERKLCIWEVTGL